MKKKYLTSLFLILSAVVNAQSVITLVNSPQNDLDALISTKTQVVEENMNYQNSPDVGCGAWTYGGAGRGKNRCFLNFDWNQIPSNATIISAELDLFAINAGWIIIGGHNGQNEAWLKRVVDSWNPATVNWNNQPAASNTASVTLNKSTSSSQNYIGIDVTQLVLDMQSANSWYGFAFVSKDEDLNGVLSFASSNSADSSKRPHLRLTYSLPTSTEYIRLVSPKLNIYPNPSSNPTISIADFSGDVELQLFNVSGQKLGNTVKLGELRKLQLTDFNGGNNFPKGVYFVRVKTSDFEISEKIVIQ